MGGGFGDPCEICPEEGTHEFKYICPNGVGLNKDGTDVDECKANLGTCENGNCVNTDGSFQCECKQGYKKSPDNDRLCIDVDECTEITNACGSGTCTNLEGSFSCQCDSGFRPGRDSPACVGKYYI